MFGRLRQQKKFRQQDDKRLAWRKNRQTQLQPNPLDPQERCNPQVKKPLVFTYTSRRHLTWDPCKWLLLQLLKSAAELLCRSTRKQKQINAAMIMEGSMIWKLFSLFCSELRRIRMKLSNPSISRKKQSFPLQAVENQLPSPFGKKQVKLCLQRPAAMWNG